VIPSVEIMEREAFSFISPPTNKKEQGIRVKARP
jgi:hypothetical protein